MLAWITKHFNNSRRPAVRGGVSAPDPNMKNQWNTDTRARVAMAAGEKVADAVPHRLFRIMGGMIVYFWEEARHRDDCYDFLREMTRDWGAMARAGEITAAEAESLLHATLGRLTTHHPRALPPHARDMLLQALAEGRPDGGALVADYTREFGDARHLPPRPAPVSAATLAQPTTRPAEQVPPRIQATPFVLQDPSTIPRRDWLYGTHLIRKEISATLAPGGVGKTALGVAEGIAMATGQPLLGVHVARPLRVWLWNGEEPQDELMRRIGAVCLHYGITNNDLGGRLMVDNGHELPITLATQTSQGTQVFEPVVEALVAALKAREIDVMIVDPFVSTHNVTENDNNAIQKAATAWKTAAVDAGVAIALAHHTRKLNGQDATAEDARGAGALIAKARDARALNPMSEREAQTLGVDRHEFFWTGPGGKSNMAKRTGHKTWFRMVTVGLGNARSLTEPEDKVGVVVSWKPDYSVEELPAEAIDRLEAIMVGREWRPADQSVHDPNWTGVAVAEAFGVTRDDGPWIAKAKKLIRRLEAEGLLARHKVMGEHRKEITVSVFKRPVVEEDEGADEAA